MERYGKIHVEYGIGFLPCLSKLHTLLEAMHADATQNAIWMLLLMLQAKQTKVNSQYDKGSQVIKMQTAVRCMLLDIT